MRMQAEKTAPSPAPETAGGPLPAGWRWARLAALGPVTDGDWILTADYAAGGVRLLQVGDIGKGIFLGKSARFISADRAEALNCTFLEPGDILISRMPDPIGRACQLPDLGYPCITAVDVSIWRPASHAFDRRYLTHFLNCEDWFTRVKSLASGATRPRISRSSLEGLRIPLPPLPEQKRIAAILTDQLAAVEKARAAAEAQLEAAKALPAAYLREVFESEEAKGWPRKSIREVCTVHPGQHILESDYSREQTGVGYLTGPADFGKTTAIVTKWTTKPRAWCEPGDVLVTVKGAGVGKINLAPSEHVAIGRQLMAIRPNRSLMDQLFLFYSVTMQFALLQNSALGATVPGLGRKNIEGLEIVGPSLREQRRIAARLNEQMAAVERLRQKLEEQLDLINKLPAALLRQAFSGEL